MGGEKSTGLDATSETIGSPPRGRRKVVEMWQSASDPGITPAWAGKSLCCCLVHRFPGDHPRMGGEKPFLFYGGSSDSGSPPHGRGKVHVLCLKGGNVGITPAWAGKSEVSKYAAKPGEDHPRVGGEKIIWASVSIAALESPPHGRGKAAAFDDNGYVNRITPAWAGKRGISICTILAVRDHPRMGGEKLTLIFLVFFAVGSPPHGRGKVTAFILAYVAVGITPA